MSGDFVINDSGLRRDMSIIRRLELQHARLEEKANKMRNERRTFKAHPKRLSSDSETTLSVTVTPRLVPTGSSSASRVDTNKPSVYQERKQKAQSIRQKLHESLCILDKSPLQTSPVSVRNNFDVSKEIINERFRTLPVGGYYDTSSGESLDFEDYNKPRNNNNKEKNSKDSRKPGPKIQNFYSKSLTLLEFEKKCKLVLEKNIQFLTEIRTTLAKGITPPDGEEDEQRRNVRIKEFSNRFSRNYLYPLSRQVKELSPPTLNEMLAKQKILTSYQIVLNGLQAYQSHLTTSGGETSYNQLKILMNNIIELCEVHRTLIKDGDGDYVMEFVDSLKINAEMAIQNVDDLGTKRACSVTDSVLKSEVSNASLNKYAGNQNKKPGSKKDMKNVRKNPSGGDNRYSMYTATASFRRDAYFRKTVENLAKKKFNVKSKYKTATYKHRPPLQKEPDILTFPRLKLLGAKKSGVLKSTRLNSPLNEDAIETMVENDDQEPDSAGNKDTDEKNQLQNPKEEILIKLLQYTLKQHKDEHTDNDTQLAELFKLVQKEPNIDFIKTILDNVSGDDQVKNRENKQNLTLEIVKSQSNFSSDGGRSSREKSSRREPRITVSGEKNARLICITDDNSVVEDDADDNQDTSEKVCQTDNIPPAKIIIRTSSETQTDLNNSNQKVAKGTQKSKNATFVKISRLKKSNRKLECLDKKKAVQAIQYKLDFYRHCKNNPLYKRSTTCQPWLLMNKISEEILNDCLLAVAREIEVNDIVEKVYQSELQM